MDDKDDLLLDDLLILDLVEETVSIKVWFDLAGKGDYQAIISAIEKGTLNPSSADKFGNTVWHILAQSGHYDNLLQAIAGNIFDPAVIVNVNGSTVWHSLATGGHLDKLLQAMNERKFNPATLVNKRGCTVWHQLLKYDHLDKLLQAVNSGYVDQRSLLSLYSWLIALTRKTSAKHAAVDKILQSIDRERPDAKAIANLTKAMQDALHDPYRELTNAIQEKMCANVIANAPTTKPISSAAAASPNAEILELQKQLDEKDQELQKQAEEIAELKKLTLALQGSSAQYALDPQTVGQRPIALLPLYAKRTANATESPMKKARFGVE